MDGGKNEFETVASLVCSVVMLSLRGKLIVYNLFENTVLPRADKGRKI